MGIVYFEDKEGDIVEGIFSILFKLKIENKVVIKFGNGDVTDMDNIIKYQQRNKGEFW